jgi:hypothetical protein
LWACLEKRKADQEQMEAESKTGRGLKVTDLGTNPEETRDRSKDYGSTGGPVWRPVS